MIAWLRRRREKRNAWRNGRIDLDDAEREKAWQGHMEAIRITQGQMWREACTRSELFPGWMLGDRSSE